MPSGHGQNGSFTGLKGVYLEKESALICPQVFFRTLFPQRKESRFKRMSRTIWHCECHIVWAPKYRFRVLEGKVKEEVELSIREQSRQFPGRRSPTRDRSAEQYKTREKTLQPLHQTVRGCVEVWPHCHRKPSGFCPPATLASQENEQRGGFRANSSRPAAVEHLRLRCVM